MKINVLSVNTDGSQSIEEKEVTGDYFPTYIPILEPISTEQQLKDLQDRLASTQDALDALLMGDVTPTTDTTT